MFKKLFGRNRNKPVEPVFPEENFSIFQVNLEDGLAFATINTGYDHYPNKRHFPWCAQVELTIQDKNSNGHRTDEEAVILNEIEEKITGFLKQSHAVHAIGRVTRNGARDIMYYLDNPRFNQQELKNFFDGINAIRNLNFTINNDPTWNLVGAFIK